MSDIDLKNAVAAFRIMCYTDNMFFGCNVGSVELLIVNGSTA